MRVLVLNAGSATLKHAVLDVGPGGEITSRTGATVDLDGDGHAEAALRALDALHDGIGAVGHRLVHGGPRHAAPARVDDALRAELDTLSGLAPLHLPPQIAVLDEARRRLPDVPHVACFDTAFHRAMPETAQRLPLPERYWRAGVRRYGFHGLSYESLMGALGDDAAGRRVVLAHLGNGASMAAVHDRRPVDTTMALTPAGGLMMGTRTGDLDPGVLIHLLRTEHLDAEGMESLVTRRAGLRGVSGISSDMRTLLARRAGEPAADRAVTMFCRTARMHVGALAAAMGGLDLLVFSGGIGEHAAPVRAEVCEGLAHLGVVLDAGRNDAGTGRISADGAACEVRVIATDEERVIAVATARVAADGAAADTDRVAEFGI